MATDPATAPAAVFDVRPPAEDYFLRNRIRGQRIEICDAAERLFIATWGATGRVIDFGDKYIEHVCSEEAVVLDFVRGGIAPVRTKHDDYSLEGQIGTLRACKIENDTLTLIGQIGYSPTAEWFWRNLNAGIIYGCSVGSTIYDHVEINVPIPAPKPVWQATRWSVDELTICQARCGRDDRARVAHALNLGSLLARWLHEDAELEERERNALPEHYAEPLRRRVTDIAVALAERLGVVGVDAIEPTLREELEAFIENVG